MAGNLAYSRFARMRDAPIEEWERLRDMTDTTSPDGRKARDHMTIAIESRRHQEAARRS